MNVKLEVVAIAVKKKKQTLKSIQYTGWKGRNKTVFIHR